MGSGRFDSSTYASSSADTARTAQRRGISTKDAAFAYSYDTKAKPQTQWKAHDSLDPLLIKGIRESRDTEEHPTTIAIAAFFDVTGSMGSIPQVFQEKLPKLMTLLTTQGGIEHPHVLFGGIGDAHCDRVPFQVGQFESDNRCDEQLRNMFLEAGGGGQVMESYELALYFAGYKTALDCWEKRQKKGYLFTLGDECFYAGLPATIVKKVFGDDLTVGSLAFEDLVKKASETFEYFHFHVVQGSYPNDAKVLGPWKKALGERLLMLDDSEQVCEAIAGVVSIFEGADLSTIDDTGIAKVVANLKRPRVISGA